MLTLSAVFRIKIIMIAQLRILLLFLPFLFNSCISDDYENCFGIRLNIEIPWSTEKAEQLNIFVFNSEGKQVAYYEKAGRQVVQGIKYLLQLPEGVYHVVVWGDVKGRYAFDYAAQELKKLESDFFSHRVVTKFDADNFMLTSELAPVFHGSEFFIELKANETKDITMRLVKNTNKLKVNISGLSPNVAYENLEVGVSAQNWQYHFDNSIPDGIEPIVYLPYESTVFESKYEAHISVLRLVKGRNPLLYIKDKSSGRNLLSKNLVNLLLNLPYTNLDHEDFFEIDLDFRGPTVSIKVNGWVVHDTDQVLP